eukprot:jgi/Antlo1/222/1504
MLQYQQDEADGILFFRHTAEMNVNAHAHPELFGELWGS